MRVRRPHLRARGCDARGSPHTAGTVIYQEVGWHDVVRVPCRVARVLKFMAPLFFANAGVLKVCRTACVHDVCVR